MAEDTPVPGTPGDEAAPGAGAEPDRQDAAGAAGRRTRSGGAKGTPSGTTAGGSARKTAGGSARKTADAGAERRADAGAERRADAEAGKPTEGGAKKPAGAAGGPAAGAPAARRAAAGVTRALAPAGRVLTSRRAPRLRAGVATFLVIAAVVAVLVSTLGLWAHGVIFNTDNYVKVVAPVAQDPQVRAAVSTYVAARAVEAADLDKRIERALPSGAKVLAPALTRSLQRYLADEIDGFLGTPQAQRLWVAGNRFAHEQLITALRDQNRSITIGRDDVKLNLLPLVAVAIQRLETRVPRLLGRDVALPKIDPATAPSDIRTLLQDALGRPLPTDFGSVTLLRGTQGYEAKRALRLFNDLVILVVVVTVVLILAALLVSVRRRHTALWLGLGSLLAFIAARVIEVRLEKAIVAGIKSQGGAAVARSVVGSAVGSLNSFLVWIAVAGAIVAVAAFLAGRPEWLDAMGRGFAKLFGVASDLSTPDTGAGRWMATHLDLLRVAGVAVAIVVLLFMTGSLTAVIIVVLALAVYELALGAYALGVPKELEDARERGGDGRGAGGSPGAPAA